MKRLKSLLLLLLTFIGGVFILWPASAAAATVQYDPSRLIDDFVFTNDSTMTAAQIQIFLQNEGSGLASYSDVESCSPSVPTQPYSYTYYPNCGKSESAATLVYDAAKAYHINPQAILATMQKEQSLITTPNPTSSQLNCAMGYLSCGSGVSGFFSQVDNGTWQLRLDVQLMNGQTWWGYSPSTYPCKSAGYITANNSSGQSVNMRVYSAGLYPGATVTFDNPAVYYWSGSSWALGGGKNPTVPQTVTLTTSATAALDCYTPYVGPYSSTGYSGSYNFVYWWNQWWGSTYANDTFTPHPNGTLVSSGGNVYLISNGVRDLISNAEVFLSYGYTWDRIKTATTGDMNLSAGTTISTLAPGTLFQSSDSNVYMMTYESGSLVKQHVSYDAFTKLGYSWSEILHVQSWEVPAATSSTVLTTYQHPAGTVIIDPSTGKAYLLDQTTKRWIINGLAFSTNYFNWSDVKTATSLDLSLPDGSNVDLGQGAMLNVGGSIYLVDYDGSGVTRRLVGPWECYSSRWHYTLNDSFSTSAGFLPSRDGGYISC